MALRVFIILVLLIPIEFSPKCNWFRGIVCVSEETVKVTPVKEEEGRGVELGILYISWILLKILLNICFIFFLNALKREKYLPS